MRVVVLILVLLTPTIAPADDAQRDLVVEYKRLARELAQSGNCEGVRDLGDRVREADAAFFTAEFATDPLLAPCLAPPSSPAAITPVDAPAPLAPPSTAPIIDREPAPPPPGMPDRPEVPPLDGGRIAGEILVGGLTGLVGLAGGALLGALVCVDDDGGDLSCLGSVIVGGYFGGALMYGLGVYAVGNAGEQTGSLGGAMLGSMIGAGLGIAALLAFEGNGSGDDGVIALALIGGPVAGGVIGFNMTRRWKQPKFPAVGSLLRLDRGGVSLGMPMVVHGEQRGVATTSIPLISGSF